MSKNPCPIERLRRVKPFVKRLYGFTDIQLDEYMKTKFNKSASRQNIMTYMNVRV